MATKKKTTKKTTPPKAVSKAFKDAKAKVTPLDKVLKLVAAVDGLELKKAELEDKIQLKLKAVVDAGGKNFIHPERGAISVMCRNGWYYWRSKPKGRVTKKDAK